MNRAGKPLDTQNKKNYRVIRLNQSFFHYQTPEPLSLTQNPFVCFCLKQLSDTESERILSLLRQQHGLNSNIVLFVAWHSLHQYGRLTAAALRQLQDKIAYWHEAVVRPFDY